MGLLCCVTNEWFHVQDFLDESIIKAEHCLQARSCRCWIMSTLWVTYTYICFIIWKKENKHDQNDLWSDLFKFISSISLFTLCPVVVESKYTNLIVLISGRLKVVCIVLIYFLSWTISLKAFLRILRNVYWVVSLFF